MRKSGKNLKKLFKNFIKCGLIGWIMENTWTGFLSFRRREKKLKCTSSVWMFPIYGLACLFEPLSSKIKNKCVIVRGFIYTIFIFSIEFFSGFILKKNQCCPWDYSKKKYNIKGVIRLDYSPLWFALGLIMEKVILKKEKTDP